MLKDNIKEVVNLYEKYGEDFRKVFYHIAADVLGDVFSNYMTAQLFSDRAVIVLQFQNSLALAIDKEHASLISLQLLHMEIPSKIKDILLIIDNMNIDIQIAKNFQNAVNTRLYAEKMKAMIMVDAIKKKADLLEAEYLNKCRVKVENSQNLIKSIQPGLVKLRNSLGFTSKDFISYVYIHNPVKGRLENVILPKNFH